MISKCAAAALLVTAQLCAVGQFATAVDPEFAKNITVFHINPRQYGAVPLNMDTGDASGDLFFDMHNSIIYPIECPEGPDTPISPSSHHHNGCVNPEAYGSELVVNKLILEVDTRYSQYAKCNIGVNGSDAHGHACPDNEYCCFCDNFGTTNVTCNSTIGFMNISKEFAGGGYARHCGSPSDCYREKSVMKLDEHFFGAWYSTLDLGCKDPTNATDDCTWRVVSIDAIINRTCHNDQFMAAVAQYNQTCFDSCHSSNSTDLCHAVCFYETVLGPGASSPTGHVSPETGVPTAQLVKAWLSGFRPEAEGGCPRLPLNNADLPQERKVY